MNSSSPYAVEFDRVSKAFGTCQANSEVSFAVRKGAIHALIGENGAGKSTAMKMLYGMVTPDSGQIRVNGQTVSFQTPRHALRAGVGMVHQHFMLAGPHKVWENIHLGAENSSPLSWLSEAEVCRRLEELGKQNGLSTDCKARIEDLPVGVQQKVEILKLLYRNSEILILDEPTAVLTPGEVTELLAQLVQLKKQGKTILIITHKLKEILAIADTATVLRGGRSVAEFDFSEKRPSLQEVAEAMVGRAVDLEGNYKRQPPRDECAFRVKDLNYGLLKGLDLEVRAGEILGIAGVEGNGQSELLEALCLRSELGAAAEGEIEILGHTVDQNTQLNEIREWGVGTIPEDRHRDGVLLGASLRDNLLLGYQEGRFNSSGIKKGIIDQSKLDADAEKVLKEFDIRPADPHWILGGLSGGNQQKLVVGREFLRAPRALIVAQPTRGVDVGAVEFIHQKLMDARNSGVGILLVSSELDEIFKLSDRLLVLYSGRKVGELERPQFDEKRVGLAMAGGGGL